MEHATAHRNKEAKRVWKRHCVDKRTEDLNAAKRLAELQRQHGNPEPVSLELAKARTRIAKSTLQ